MQPDSMLYEICDRYIKNSGNKRAELKQNLIDSGVKVIDPLVSCFLELRRGIRNTLPKNTDLEKLVDEGKAPRDNLSVAQEFLLESVGANLSMSKDAELISDIIFELLNRGPSNVMEVTQHVQSALENDFEHAWGMALILLELISKYPNPDTIRLVKSVGRSFIVHGLTPTMPGSFEKALYTQLCVVIAARSGAEQYIRDLERDSASHKTDAAQVYIKKAYIGFIARLR